MSLAIPHSFMTGLLSFGVLAPRRSRPVEAEPPRRGRSLPAGDERARKRARPSLFHRLAAADFAARDLAFPLFLNPTRR